MTRESRRIANWQVLLLVCLVFYWSIRVGRHAASSLESDFGVYYRAGEAIAERGEIYSLSHGFLLTFKYAPIVALAWAPLTALGPVAARVVWFFIDLICFALFVRSALRIVRIDRRLPADRPLLIGGTLILTLGHIVAQLQSGQSTSLWLLLTAWSFEAMSAGRAGRAGSYLAGAMCLKCVPVVLLPFLIMDGGSWRRALLGMGGTTALLLLLPAAWTGWSENLRALSQWPTHLVATMVPEQLLRPENQSILAQASRWGVYGVGDVERGFAVGRLAWWVSALIAGGAIFLRGARRGLAKEPAALFSLLMIYMTLWNPLAWRYNFIALVAPFAYVLADLLSRAKVRDLRWLLLGAASFVNTVPLPDGLMEQGGRVWGTMLLLWAVVQTMTLDGTAEAREAGNGEARVVVRSPASRRSVHAAREKVAAR